MVGRPARRQIFAVNCTAPARHDRRAEPGHPTSEMIQEDMKILEPRSDLVPGDHGEENAEKRNTTEGNEINICQVAPGDQTVLDRNGCL